MVGEIEMRYVCQPGAMSTVDLQKELQDLWLALGDDQELRNEAEQAGIDPDGIRAEYSSLPLSVSPDEAGFDPVTILIVASGVVAKDLWQQVLLPRIRAKYGDDAVRERRNGE